MVDTEVLFSIADAAEVAGDFDLARQSFERGAALGSGECLSRLTYMFDVGVGVVGGRSTPISASAASKQVQPHSRCWAGLEQSTLFQATLCPRPAQASYWRGLHTARRGNRIEPLASALLPSRRLALPMAHECTLDPRQRLARSASARAWQPLSTSFTRHSAFPAFAAPRSR